MGRMRIIDETGDTTLEWTVDDPASRERAERAFAELRAKRRIPFARAAGAPAAEAANVTNFDPAADEIVWVRPLAGG